MSEYYLTLQDGKLERHKTDCPLTLETMQKAVGGYIDVWVNEEGLLQQLPFTCYLAALSQAPMAIVGPVLCAGDSDGDCVGLTEKELDQIAFGGVVLAILEPGWTPETDETSPVTVQAAGPYPPEPEPEL